MMLQVPLENRVSVSINTRHKTIPFVLFLVDNHIPKDEDDE